MLILSKNTFYTIGHRGMEIGAVENTLDAVIKADELGLDFIELDVQFSKDGIPFLFHDKFLHKKTGLKGRIRDHYSKDLAGVYVKTPRGESPLTSLEQALEYLSGNGNLSGQKHRSSNLILELKDVRSMDNLRVLKNLLSEYNFIDRTIIDSFFPDYLVMMNSILPDVFYSLLIKPIPKALQFLIKVKVVLFGKKVPIKAISVYSGNLTDKLIEWAHSNDLLIFLWGVKDKNQYRRLLDSGINGFTAPDPRYLVEIIEKRKKTE